MLPANMPEDGKYLKVSYDRARICKPGKKLKSWDRFTAHPSPEPVNLMCRSYNAFASYLYATGQLTGMKNTSGHRYCKLFPSCLDGEGVINCCYLCIACWLLENLYPLLSPEDRGFLLDTVALEIEGDYKKCKEILLKYQDLSLPRPAPEASSGSDGVAASSPRRCSSGGAATASPAAAGYSTCAPASRRVRPSESSVHTCAREFERSSK